jgi:DNA-binding LacI/PurR family transcriptional regulator
VSPETAARVRQAIAELKYFPNPNAKSLVLGRTHILGIIVSDITNPFFPELIQGFESVAIEHGYEIIVASSNYDSSRMDQCVRRLIRRSVDAVAIMTSEFDPAIIKELTHLKVPTVFLDVGKLEKRVSNIRVDYSSGIREAVAHLLSLGHTRVSFISGPRALKSARIRQAAFLSSMRESNIAEDPKLVVEGNHGIDGGLQAMRSLLRFHRPPTAVLASNDLTAIGAMHAIRRAGLGIPEGISLIGFDDIEMARFTDPPLTTVRLSRAEIARAAFDALMAILRQEKSYEIKVATHLVIRESTGPCTSQGPILIR